RSGRLTRARAALPRRSWPSLATRQQANSRIRAGPASANYGGLMWQLWCVAAGGAARNPLEELLDPDSPDKGEKGENQGRQDGDERHDKAGEGSACALEAPERVKATTSEPGG